MVWKLLMSRKLTPWSIIPLKTPESSRDHCKKPGLYKNQCRQLKKQKKLAADTKTNCGTINGAPPSSNSNTNNNNHNSNSKNDRKLRTVHISWETCGKTSQCTERCYFGANEVNRPPLRGPRESQVEQNDTQNCTKEIVQAAAQPLT